MVFSPTWAEEEQQQSWEGEEPHRPLSVTLDTNMRHRCSPARRRRRHGAAGSLACWARHLLDASHFWSAADAHARAHGAPRDQKVLILLVMLIIIIIMVSSIISTVHFALWFCFWWNWSRCNPTWNKHIRFHAKTRQYVKSWIKLRTKDLIESFKLVVGSQKLFIITDFLCFEC